MGDFYVPPLKLKETIGIEVIPLDEQRFKSLAAAVTEDEIEEEREVDRQRFGIDDLNEEVYLRSLRIVLALQKWTDEEKLSAFTFNFLLVNRQSALYTVPFLQTSKFMAQGIGFGGEGDTLTASLVSTLDRGNPDTSFSEMFCPDWENSTIFLSHMGESNYRLIVAPATMIEVTGKNNMADRVHGWFKPRMPIEGFLAEYSRQGGTHHLAISYGASIRMVEAFGRMMVWETVVIG